MINKTFKNMTSLSKIPLQKKNDISSKQIIQMSIDHFNGGLIELLNEIKVIRSNINEYITGYKGLSDSKRKKSFFIKNIENY